MNERRTNGYDVLIIGGGAAGMMAAITAAEDGASVAVLEGNDRLGRKLRITGKGRCNVTNDCSPDEVMENIPRGGRFLKGALYRFTPADVMAFFESHGVPLKTERGRRVFPVSDRAADIVRALEKAMEQSGVRVVCTKAQSLILEDGRCTGVMTERGAFTARAVIVATGGASYSATGSRGDGYRFARQAELQVIPPTPSLVPIVTEEDTAELSGLSLKNVVLRVMEGEKTIYSEMGEMLFTHFGVSGPLVLTASAHMRGPMERYGLYIDLKPALDEGTLDTRLVSDLSKFAQRDLVNSLGELLPQKLIEPVIAVAGLDPRKKSGAITKMERRALLATLKAFPLTPLRFRSMEEAIITAGGVDVQELNGKTMMAKSVPGLFFAGEVIDADAYTGGFNLQIAFSTAVAAGHGAAEFAEASV